jgi:hypothetical protein
MCEHCGNEMIGGEGCVCISFDFADGTTLLPIKFGDEEAFKNQPGMLADIKKCPDCGCPRGTYHHIGCDMEICPSCHEQAISCDCKLK